MPGTILLAALCLGLGSAAAQMKPPESTSKVKKVLLYNKIGGWVRIDGVAAVKAAFSQLAAAKGFELVQLADDSEITLEYLKQFQVIVWNNNSDGAASVPYTRARQAIFDYLEQGGGWLLIHGAGQHQMSWAELGEAMGTDYYGWGMQGSAEVVLDEAGKSHKELKWMMQGFPETFTLVDLWMTFKKTVRPLPGVTVVATSRGAPNIVRSSPDNSGDNVYIWAREIGKGRFFYNGIGHGQNNLMEQQDSIVPKLYWENLRYAAGDYQNGCTNLSSPAFDPTARIHVETMCAVSGIKAAPALSGLVVSKGAMSRRLAVPGGPLRVRFRDPGGSLVWERGLPAGTGELPLDDAVRPGVYLVEIRGATQALQSRLVLP